MGKHAATSKTVLANIIAIGAGYAANKFGFEIGAEDQVAILGVLNIILRVFFTKGPVRLSVT